MGGKIDVTGAPSMSSPTFWEGVESCNVLLLSRPYTQDLKEKSQEKEFHAPIFKPGTPQNSLVS